MRNYQESLPLSLSQKLVMLVLLAFGLLTFSLLTYSPNVGAQSTANFQAGNIIDDSVFFNDNAMSINQIQQFMNSKVPSCDTHGEKEYRNSGLTRAEWAAQSSSRQGPPYTCLKEYTQNIPGVTNGGSDLCAGSISSGTKSSARIIHEVSKACGINPQVLLVMMQKEFSLVTDDWTWQIQYDRAMGYACPDSGPNYSANCDASYYGFFNQVYNAAKAFRRYEANPTQYNYRANRNNSILYNPNPDCGSSNVFIENQATANLYIYTPYQPNSATLAAAPGQEVHCGAYGNLNFWRFFNNWFGTVRSSPFFRFSNGSAIYIMGAEDKYYHVPNNSVLEAYGYWRTIHKIEVVSNDFVDKKTFAGKLNSFSQYQGDAIYIVNSGKRHHVPNLATLADFGPNKISQLPLGFKYYLVEPTEKASNVFKKSHGGDEIYVAEGGHKRHITSLAYRTKGDPIYNSRPLVAYSNYFVDSVKQGPPALGEGEVIQNTTSELFGVYQDDEIRYATTEQIGKDWGLKKYYDIKGSLADMLTQGPELGRHMRDSDGSRYLIDNGQKIPYDPPSSSHLGLSIAAFSTVPDNLLEQLPLRVFKNTVKSVGNDAVYKVADQELMRIASKLDFELHGYQWDEILNVSQGFAATLINNGVINYADSRLVQRTGHPEIYLVDMNGATIKHIPSLSVFKAYGWSGNDVKYINQSTFDHLTEDKSLTNILLDDGDYWIVDNGFRRLIPQSLVDENAYPFDYENVTIISDVNFDYIKVGLELTNLVRDDRDGKVYFVENGEKRWFPNKDIFSENGGDWSEVRTMSPYIIDNIPTGPNVE